MSELKPCPFCGDANVGLHPPTCDRGAEYDPLDRAFPIIRCGGCYAEAHGDNWDHRGQSVIASWNRRAAPVVSEEMARRGEAARVRYMENVAADRVGSMMAALTAALGDGNTAPPPADQR